MAQGSENTTTRAYQASLEMFLRRTYESMLQERDMRRRENAKLRVHCEEAVKELTSKASRPKAGPSVLEDGSARLPPLSNDMEKGVWLLQNPILLRPLIGACECRSSPKVTVTAIDCLQKLIAYGHITNTMLYHLDGTTAELDPETANIPETDSPPRGRQRLIEFLVDLICQAFQSDNTDEGVMLQIVKALLTIMTSSLVTIHDKYVMNVFRTCYNIFMASRNPVNQLTAKATLTQMLTQIFQRMETASVEETAGLSVPAESSTHLKAKEVDSPGEVTSLTPTEHSNGLASTVENEDDAAASAVLQQLLSTVEEADTRDFPDREKLSPTPSMTESQTFIMNSPNLDTSASQKYSQLVQKDAFHVFRSICYLSMKTLPEGSQLDPKSHYYRSKILSLELLLSILQNPGPVFRSSEIFIRAIRQYLCIALPKNGGCSSIEVFELTVLIFLSLLTHFKQFLKPQIEIFFKEIFLYILETPSSSFEHKLLVTEALGRICLNAQCVFDLYINYDCDMTSANIFEKLVNVLAKIAQLKQTPVDVLNPSVMSVERNRLKMRGLECLVHILKCMVEWSRDLYHIPEHSTLGASENTSEPAVNGVHSSIHLIKSDSQQSIPLNADDPEQFESVKQRKDLLEKDIHLFNRKPSQGLKALQSHGFTGESVEDVAAFLMQEDPRLDLTVVGDFLGDADDFNRRVMYAYIDRMNFTGLDFVAALRLFLSGFRLPGEAQKIDRLMEKFASRYVECNPESSILSSADTAYVLAYSIIMLTTSLHSSQLKKQNRMTKEEYLRMGKGINNAGDLPEEYLASIYDEIASRELKMKATASAVASSRLVRSNAAVVASGSAGEKQRRLLFDLEMESMTRAAKALMESLSHHPLSCDFTSASHAEHVRPMFKIVWTPFLAAFSVGLQDCDDVEVTRLCLEGIRCAIRIACLFHLELERDAYVQALAHFTMLTSSTAQGAGDIKSKHVECIKTLISVAYTDGRFLGPSWLEILRCFSQLESAHLIGQQESLSTAAIGGKRFSISTNDTSSPYASDNEGVVPHSQLLRVSVEQQLKKLAVIQEVMGETGSQSLVVAVDKIFASSSKLDGEAIVHFVQALCQVSREELACVPPRIFSLQKLVEISYYNMGRVRLQWSRTWNYIGQHFYAAGCSTNPDVAFFAVDSLRQLSVKFIEKGEFANFHFQKDFLRPFVNILEDCHNRRIEDMVVTCVQQLVASNWFNIRSGWANIFTVFSLVARLDNEAIVKLAFQTCTFAVNDFMKSHLTIMVDSFKHLVTALAEFACNLHFPDISMDAISLIRLCAKHVQEQSHVFLVQPRESSAALLSSISPLDLPVTSLTHVDEDRVWIKGWLPVLCELFRVIHNCKLDVRTRGLTVFFDILKTYGGVFSDRWWRETFFIIFRIFSCIPTSDVSSQNKSPFTITPMASPLHGIAALGRPPHADRSEWLTTTCNHSLYSIVDVFTQYYGSLHRVMLDDFYQQLRWFCQQEHEQLARSGTSCFETFILSNGHRFTPSVWQKTCDLLRELFHSSTPHLLLSWKPAQNSLEDEANAQSTSLFNTFSILLVNCVVQFELIHLVNNILFYPSTTRKEDEANLKLANVLCTRKLHSQYMFFASKKKRKQEDLCDWLVNETEISDLENGSNKETLPQDDAAVSHARLYSSERESSSLNEGLVDMRTEATEDSHISPPPLDEVSPETLCKGVYDRLSVEQLLHLARTLIQSHEFAKKFNSNHEQRNLLWRAGFKGKTKPNLLNQEINSLACALRIYFRLLSDTRTSSALSTEIERDLHTICGDALQCYGQLNSDTHQDAWTPVLILLLLNLLHLRPAERAKGHLSRLFPLLCDICQLNRVVPLPVRGLISRCLLRCGYLNQPPSEESDED